MSRTWFGELLDSALGDNYGALGAPPLKLLKGYPSAGRGQTRAGHLSIDAKLRAARAKARAKFNEPGKTAGDQTAGRLIAPPKGSSENAGRLIAPPKGTQNAGRLIAPPKGTQNAGRLIAPPKGTQNMGRLVTVPSGANQRTGTQTQPAARGRTVRLSPGALTRPAGAQFTRLSGPDDEPVPGDVLVPFTPNARVWVTSQLLPLCGPVETQADGQYLIRTRGPQMHWPDGTPVVGSFWLPMLDLSPYFDPRLPDSWVQGPDPFSLQVPDPADRRQRVTKAFADGSGWSDNPDARQLFGGKRAWDWIKGVSKTRPYGDPNFQPPISTPFDFYADEGGQVDGRPAHIQHWFASFDWSQRAPDLQAAIWLWLNLWDPTGVTWTVQEAEIRRADTRPVEEKEPTQLPGVAYLCLDVLDAMQTGAHGMPIMVKAAPDGTAQLDKAALTQFTHDHPEWLPFLNDGPGHDGMLAIVNDLGARVGGVVYAPPPPPPDTSPPPDVQINPDYFGPPVDPFAPPPEIDPFAPPGGYPPGGYPPGYDPYAYGGYPPGYDPYGGEFDLNWLTSEDFAPTGEQPAAGDLVYYEQEPIAADAGDAFEEFVEEDAGGVLVDDGSGDGWPEDTGDGWLWIT